MIRMLWAAQLKSIGNAYGYSTQANRMLEQLRLRDDVVVSDELGGEFDLAVHVITPDQFRPIPGIPNLLFTMYEATSIPDQWIEPINRADALVVPCKQNVELFQRYYRRGKVARCRLGINPGQFPFHYRRAPAPGEAFRFLWVGAPNPRKGFQLAIAAWSQWLNTRRMPKNVELYMKSSGTEEEKVTRFKAAVQQREKKNAPLGEDGKPQMEYILDFFEEKDVNPGAPYLPGITFDTRDYSPQQMTELYNSAHAFVLPSVGEGWGLTLCEALATGAPSIWTHWSGPRDFADDSVGFPIHKWSHAPMDMMSGRKKEDGSWEIFKSHTSFGALAHGDALVKRFEQIYFGYDQALERGLKASQRMHAQFKWSDCADEFVQICRKFLEGR